MSRLADTPILPCSLVLGLAGCATPERHQDAFASSAGGTDQGVGDTGAASSSDGGSAPTSSAGDVDTSGGAKFDVGDSADLPGGPGDDNASGDGCKFLDLLFVVDISGSMSEEKENLNANFPAFVEVLDDYVSDPTHGALGYRLGVTNSSHQADGSTTGLDGELANSGGFGGGNDCGTGGNRWIDGPAPGIAGDFSCLANNPMACTNSCSDLGVERPLDSIMGFIDKSAQGQVNDGFYRGDEESLLVIVTLTDEDDQSVVTPAGGKAELDAFAQGEERYVVVTVSGRQNAPCNSAFGEASAAPRLHEFTNSVSNGLMGDICEGDLTAALQEALELITFSCTMLPPPEG